MVEVDSFKRPWSMEPFARRGLGEIYLRSLTKPAFRLLMRLQGVADMRSIGRDELDAYVDLLRMRDGGSAFLRMMRGFERTIGKRDLYRAVLRDVQQPGKVGASGSLFGALVMSLKPSAEGRRPTHHAA